VSARHVDHLLIGGGVASATCAATLREEGAAGAVLVVGREPEPPYHRPPVTKGVLRGTQVREDAWVHPAGWWDEHDVELMVRTRAMALDPAARTATLSTGKEVGAPVCAADLADP
jgi:3-phenylpropionate/trans-cinnamate dioxygenase ferredoxin reductase subunit